MATAKSKGGARDEGASLPLERELIVILNPADGVRAGVRGVRSVKGELAKLNKVLSDAEATIAPLFGGSEERVSRGTRALRDRGVDAPDLAKYYRVNAPDEHLDSLAEKLRKEPQVDAAYVKPAAEPAVLNRAYSVNDMLPSAEEAPGTTPDFTARQTYLDAAPGGIDARYSWTVPGGGGAGVNIIDVEGAWRFTHEDLGVNQGGVVGGTPSTDLGWRNHGTAVLGEFSGDRNAFGITGICPDATVRAVSIFGGLGSAGAIRRAADLLGPGDILLIELHRPGPRATGSGQQGYIAVEWWPDDYDAIRYAVGRGVVVVEAAGNGAEDLDNPAYDTPSAGFPTSWSNPFRRGARDSGAILVGAGAPPPGTHGRDWGPDRSRLDFSNYGAAVDVQGWGREVTTTGYGDLQGGASEDLWYTDQFSGTSSASPIIVGTLGCVQGVLRAAHKPLLTPATARAALRASGSPQQDAPGRPASQRIGNRPDLRALLASTGMGVSVPLHRYWNATIADHFYTTALSELGSGRYGWAYEGVQCYVFPTPVPGSVPLYRYWNPGIGDHFYTTSWAELGNGRFGWGYEGVQGYVFPSPVPGSVPLHRYWNAGNGDHFYTTSWSELGSGRYGWAYEGVQCHVLTTATTPPAAPPGADTREPGVPATFTTTPASFGAEREPGSGPGASFRAVEASPPASFRAVEASPPASFSTSVADAPGGSFVTTAEATTGSADPARSFTVDKGGAAVSTDKHGVRVVITVTTGDR